MTHILLVAENKSKYKLWGSFYLVTVTYIYLTRILVEFLKVALPFQYVTWLVELLNEAITLGFYATIGCVSFSIYKMAYETFSLSLQYVRASMYS